MNKNLLISLEQQNGELMRLKQKLEDENAYFKEEIKTNKNFENIISEDNSFLKTLKGIEQIATSDAPCLIYGETGTGKELVARAIHNLSNRKDGAFICVNCAAIPETLFESELFGHEKGAFTGATSQRKGKFELANGGTLFLDEIGEIPINLQPKLLRAIQEGQIERVGGNDIIKLNIRILAATNRVLLEEINNNKFRSDLYFRLNVYPINIPPLRERKADIPLLINHFIKKFNAKYKRNISSINKKGLTKLKQYSWPGNIRELENIVERAVLTSCTANLNIGEYISSLFEKETDQLLSLKEYEKSYILKILKKCDWRVGGDSGAAKILGLNRTTLVEKMKVLGIQKPS